MIILVDLYKQYFHTLWLGVNIPNPFPCHHWNIVNYSKLWIKFNRKVGNWLDYQYVSTCVFRLNKCDEHWELRSYGLTQQVVVIITDVSGHLIVPETLLEQSCGSVYTILCWC